MPTTPKGIFYPAGTDGYDLTVDLAAVATSVDGAIGNTNTAINNAVSNNAVMNLYKAGTAINPIPTALTDVPNTSVTFTLFHSTYCLFTFSATMQANVPMTVALYLNTDGFNQAQRIWVRNESGGEPRQQVFGQFGGLFPTGLHTVKLQANASVASVSVCDEPTWSMIGTADINGTHL